MHRNEEVSNDVSAESGYENEDISSDSNAESSYESAGEDSLDPVEAECQNLIRPYIGRIDFFSLLASHILATAEKFDDQEKADQFFIAISKKYHFQDALVFQGYINELKSASKEVLDELQLIAHKESMGIRKKIHDKTTEMRAEVTQTITRFYVIRGAIAAADIRLSVKEVVKESTVTFNANGHGNINRMFATLRTERESEQVRQQEQKEKSYDFGAVFS